MSIIDKSTKQAEWFPKAVGSRRGENTELTFNEYQLSFWHDKKKKHIKQTTDREGNKQIKHMEFVREQKREREERREEGKGKQGGKGSTRVLMSYTHMYSCLSVGAIGKQQVCRLKNLN